MSFFELRVDFNNDDWFSNFFIDHSDTNGSVSQDSKIKRPDDKLRLAKRTAYPSTYIERQGNNIIAGYGPSKPKADDEFMHISITPSSAKISRDIYATLPVFFSFVNGTLVAGNNFAWVVNSTNKLTFDPAHALELLTPFPDRHSTLWKEVKTLDERHALVASIEGVAIIKPAGRTSGENQSNPKEFPSILKSSLKSFKARTLHGQKFAYEVSGGIDSSLAPLFNAEDKTKLLGSMQFPGEFGTSQARKLHDLVASTGNELMGATITEITNFPLARFKNDVYPYYSYEEIYTEILHKLAQLLKQRGVDVVVTGIGGDELFENNLSYDRLLHYGEVEHKRRINEKLPPFLTETYRREFEHSTPIQAPYPMPLLAVSFHGAQLARNNIYISSGIWPVSPFAQTELYEFCQGLPAHYRINKNILRAFFEAMNWPVSIFNPTHNEHFGDFFENSVADKGFEQMIRRYAKNSNAEAMGLVNTKQLVSYYEAVQVGNADKRWLLNVFGWLSLEIGLNSVYAR